MAGAKIGVKNPGSPMQRMFGADPATATPPSDDGGEEAGETYTITPEEYAELGTNKTVKCAEGCTINLSDGADATADTAAPAPPEM